MKKSYSRWNLLQNRLNSDGGRLFKSFFTNRKYLTIELPYYDYLRGQVFLDDLRDNFRDDVPFTFDMSTLLYMLFDDFLNQIKSGGGDNSQIAGYLMAGKKKYFQAKIKETRVMRPITTHLFEFETVEEEVEDHTDDKEKTAFLEIRMRDSELLRAEVLLHDLVPFGLDITVEQVIAIVYLDFIEKVKKEGNSLKVQKSILTYLKRF